MISSPRDIILEYTRVGNVTRVTAVDSQSGTEVVFQAPNYASPSEIQKLAVNKLRYVMARQK